jgi:hypothetical protein
MNPNTEPTVPGWFMKAIASGLQALYAMSLEGTPGADVLPATVRVWAFDLWQSKRRYWVEDGDAECIRRAFQTLRETCTRWPTQPKFWDALPERPAGEFKAIGPGWGRERESDALACRARWLRDLGVDELGRPL